MKKVMTIIILLFCMYTENFCTGEIPCVKWDNMTPPAHCCQVAFANLPLSSHNRTAPHGQPPTRTTLCGWPRGVRRASEQVDRVQCGSSGQGLYIFTPQATATTYGLKKPGTMAVGGAGDKVVAGHMPFSYTPLPPPWTVWWWQCVGNAVTAVVGGVGGGEPAVVGDLVFRHTATA